MKRGVMKLDSTLKLAVYILRVIVCIAVLGIILGSVHYWDSVIPRPLNLDL